ncbi:hypothetical protein [Rubritalea sp.]|uniref:hypothetical protein n=1 Tax=Rubritalea sp. TaxID=2109375 RepID=UPI003EFB0472
MIRIVLILIVSAASFFGIVFLIETKAPDVKSMTDKPGAKATIINPHGLPSGVIGSFTLNQEATNAWHTSDSRLTDDDRVRFSETQALQELYNFDGDHLWRNSPDNKIVVITSEVTPDFVKLLTTVSLNGEELPNEFYLQWDDQGFWLSQRLPTTAGVTKLYRARYERNAAAEK